MFGRVSQDYAPRERRSKEKIPRDLVHVTDQSLTSFYDGTPAAAV
jgi:hypothetical protein